MLEGESGRGPIFGKAVGLQCLGDDLLGERCTGPAAGADPKAATQLRDVACAGMHRVADLLFRYAITDADEHACTFGDMIAAGYTIMRMIVNINLSPESWRNLRRDAWSS